MQKNNSNAVTNEKKRDLASISLIVFLIDRFADFIYNSFIGGLFGKIFTAYSAEQSSFENGFIKKHFYDGSRLRRWIRNIQKYFSRAFESSFFLNKIEQTTRSFVSFPLKSLGTFMLSFGIYVVIMYLIRLFLPIVSQADIGYLITGITVCVVSIPMLFSADNVAVAVGKSVFLGALFSKAFGVRDEAFVKRTELGRAKINFLVIIGILLGILTLVIHPLWIIAVLLVIVGIALIMSSPEIGVIIALFALPFLSFFDSPAIAMGLIVMTVTLSYFVKLIRGKRILKFEIIDLAVLLFMSVIFFSGTVTAGKVTGFQEALITCELLLGYFLTVNLIRTEKWIYRCVYALISSGTVVAMLGIVQYASGAFKTGAWLDTSYFYDIQGRSTSLFDNPNVLGMYLVMVLPFVLYSLSSTPKGRPRALAIISLVSVLLCILLTWSRGAWISAMACLLVYAVIYTRKTVRYIVLACVATPILSFFVPESITRRFLSIGNLTDSSTMYRIYTWRGTVRAIYDYFIGGVGYGTAAYREIYPQYAYAGIEAAEHSHNLYLQITIGTGIIGLVIFLTVIMLFFQMNFEYIKCSDGKFSMVVAAVVAAIIAMLVFGMFDFVWYNYRVFFMFWAIVGLSVACVRIGKNDNRRRKYNSETEII